MKRTCICLLVAVLLLSLSACASNIQKSNQSPPESDIPDVISSETDTSENSTTEEASAETPKETKTVKMTVGENELYITVYDNPTSRDFLFKLPLTLTFEDYNATEKISYLPETLTTENAPDSFDPYVGDVALYAPWGNLSVFYQDFVDSVGLISIGHIESGIKTLAEISGGFTAVLELEE